MGFDRLLLTGMTGFVGGYLAPALKERFPLAERRYLRRSQCTLDVEGWTAISGDLTDAPSLEAAVRELRPDLIVHLAASASVSASFRQSASAWTINVGGSLLLANAVIRHSPTATFLNVSSADVYGGNFDVRPVTEDTPLAPLSPYARTKACVEALLADVLSQEARLITVRPFNHTGPGQSESYALPSFAAQIARIEMGLQSPHLSVGNLAGERDFLDVRDVVDAYVKLIDAAPQLPPRSIFNVASGQCWALSDLVQRLRQLSRQPFDIVVDQERMRPVDIPHMVGDAGRLKSVTGWSPQTPIDALLKHLLDYWRQQQLSPKLS
jgi:GDP-4-dehydro-6-deoxy-D-mannose reductase